MGRVYLAGVFLLGLSLAAESGWSAEIEREVSISVSGAERTERVRTIVRPGPDEEAHEEATVVVLLDYDRQLVSAEGWCVTAGKRQKVRRRDRDVVDWPGESLADSARFLVLSCPEAVEGSYIEATYEVRGTPVFPGGRLALAPAPGDTLRRLQVEIQGEGLRWKLSGADLGLSVSEVSGRVRVEGHDVEVAEEAGPLARSLDLHYAWGPEASWTEVAGWYRALLDDLPRAAPEVRAAARSAAADLGPDQALEAIAELVQRDVRYVAVQIGVGGWIPSTPAEVWERRWGDCKDKTLLLIDLLREAGIEAYPALALLGRDRRVDPEFPTPFQFNHLVAAVRLDSLENPPPTAPIVDGWLILDGTQRRGGAGWLNSGVQGQKLLLVQGDGGELIEAPITPAAEGLRLHVTLADDRQGSLSLEYIGGTASRLQEELEVTQITEANDLARRLVNRLLGPVELIGPEWRKRTDRGAPTLILVSKLRIPEGSPVAPPEIRWLPEPRELVAEETPLPTAARVGTLELRWSGPLEAGCVSDPKNERQTTTLVGSVEQMAASPGPGRVDLVRRTTVGHRWIEDAEAFEALRDLSLAEHRMVRRQLRVLCTSPNQG